MTEAKQAIVVDKLTKQFSIGTAPRDTMLRDRIVKLLRNPLGNQAPTKTIHALRDVSFEVNPGEVVGIIGRNGAGKSTLLKILSKITYPTSGSVKVRGRVASLLEVGTGFHEELTGRENVYLNGSILGMKKREVDRKLDAIVAFSGVETFIDTPIKRYSSGMRLRLGFAVAAHLDPDLLIIDEVLAVGDGAFQKKCLSAMDDLRSGGRTVLFVSHNMAAVENLCSRGIWIDDGLVRMDGNAKDVIETYMGTFADTGQTLTDLRDVKSRKGSGEIRFTSLEFLAADRRPKSITRTGDNLIIRLHYHADAEVSFPSFGIRVFTELGTLVTETSTWHHALDNQIVSAGDGYLDLDVENLNLMPGRYYLSLWLTGVGQHLYDVVEHCARLDIELSDYYRSGRSEGSRNGIVFLPQRWYLEGVQAKLSGSDVQPVAVPDLVH